MDIGAGINRYLCARNRPVGIGAGSRNRTHDQRFTKPLLYHLSYAGGGTAARATDLLFALVLDHCLT
jgi:hypothetical protein